MQLLTTVDEKVVKETSSEKLLGVILNNDLTWNTPGTAGGPGGRDRMLAVKSRKTSENSPFFLKKIKFTPKKYLFFAYIFQLCQNIG